MTEARDALASQYPDKTICVSKEAWYYGRVGNQTKTLEYAIHVRPGFDNHISQTFGGNSLNECLRKFVNAAAGKK